MYSTDPVQLNMAAGWELNDISVEYLSVDDLSVRLVTRSRMGKDGIVGLGIGGKGC